MEATIFIYCIVAWCIVGNVLFFYAAITEDDDGVTLEWLIKGVFYGCLAGPFIICYYIEKHWNTVIIKSRKSKAE